MALNPRLWSELERCGVHDTHLEMLVRMLQSQENFRITWNGIKGRLERIDMQVSCSSKPFTVHRVCQDIFD